jgi:hypothetical protein
VRGHQTDVSDSARWLFDAQLGNEIKHNRSEMVAVLGPFEALRYYIHTYIGNEITRNASCTDRDHALHNLSGHLTTLCYLQKLHEKTRYSVSLSDGHVSYCG